MRKTCDSQQGLLRRVFLQTNVSRSETYGAKNMGENLNTREVGTHYEDAAIAYLKDKGVQIIDRNVTCGRFGEIDIIGCTSDAGKTLVFFEVKYRKDDRHGNPEEAVDINKQNKIRKCAEYYLAYKSSDSYVRFDIIAIQGEEITWYKNAF